MKKNSTTRKCPSAAAPDACAIPPAPETDWDELNRRAFEHSMIPVALPQRDGIPYWNMNARQFMMPPAFDVAEADGAAGYIFTLRNSRGEVLAEFKSDSPKTPLTEVWDRVPVGNVALSVEALDAAGGVIKEVFTREFYRSARFHGPYPSVSHDYRAAAIRSLENIFNLPHVQAWLKDGTVDEKIYRKYCYPSKTLSALIDGLLLYSDLTDEPEITEKALAISMKMADWLIDNSCPAGTPLEFLPPTYWKYATYQYARPNIGQIMMIYPTDVGNAYLSVYRRSGAAKYLEAAERNGKTMKKLELPGGSWHLKLYEKDGRPAVDNVVLINRDMVRFFTELGELSGDGSCREMSDRAYRRLLDHNLKLWDWDAQFEDGTPRAMYQNLAHNHALCLATDMFKAGDVKNALRIVDWVEDQFVVWDEPAPGCDVKTYPEWRSCAGVVTPMVVEQYFCFWPVNGSMGELIDIWRLAYQATGDRLYLEKARAMADSLIRNQRPDGSIPTWFFTTDLPDWLNCTVGTAKFLLALGDATK